MKALVLTEGSSRIGFGHITRTLSLTQALKSFGFKVHFIVYGDETVEKVLNREDFSYEIRNWFGKLPNVETYDVVIVDSYKAPLGIYKEISERVEVKLYIDDFWRLDYPPGFVLNFTPNFNRSELPQGVIPLFGIEYHLLRKSFWEVPEKPIKPEVERILITFGGDDLKNLTPSAIRCAFDAFPEAEVVAVIGGGFKNTAEIYKLGTIYGKRLKLVKNASAEEMKKLMLTSDIAICAGGQTLFELARVGTPPVVVKVADNQRRNIKGFAELGFIQFAGTWNEANLQQRIKEGLKILEPHAERLKRFKIGRRLVDGKGALRVAKILTETVGRGSQR